MFDGETAFTLYDTYGFPLDLTQDALKSRGIGVDLAAFIDAHGAAEGEGARLVVGLGDAATEAIWFPLREKLGATEFLGYETESAEGVVTALIRDGKEVSELKTGETGGGARTRRHSTASRADRSATPARWPRTIFARA